MHVTSREYKVIVDSSLFADWDAALSDIHDDVKDLAWLVGLEFDGKFDTGNYKERTILFLDTPDFTLCQNGLLLRQRVKPKKGTTEYTLKCRTEDRYIAAGKDLSVILGLRSDTKFEEDVGCPFVSRFSHSTTVSLDDDHKLAGDRFPKTLSAAAELFPGLLATQYDDMRCAPETALTAVNGKKVFERVFTGPIVQFSDRRSRSSSTSATLALILWSKGQNGRILTAEFSFRYKDDKEAFPPKVASNARRYFERLQRLDWARPEGSTKTQYMYGGM